jgi:hypothetical protein
MNLFHFYQDFHKNNENILKSLFSNPKCNQSFTRSYSLINDFNILNKIINERYESSIFKNAIKEYQYALSALTIGHYRHAYVGLRLFFELALATIYYSSYEKEYRLWVKNKTDIRWQLLIHEDNGIFSEPFITAFNEDALEFKKEYSTITSKVYRECSEYVHGNYYTHTNLPLDIKFSPDIVCSWCETADTMHLCILYAFYIRYANTLDNTSENELKEIILTYFHHEKSIRDHFS